MANRKLTPITKPFDVRLELPGSKSFANRAIVCAALAGASSTIANLSPADDTALMLNVLADLGWSVKRTESDVAGCDADASDQTARASR